MKVLTIVASTEGAEQILGMLAEADEDGEFDFPFNVHVTDELSDEDAGDIFKLAWHGGA